MLRVGSLALVVGQACACREPVAPVAMTAPSLSVPPLDGGSEPFSRTRNGAHFTHPVPRPGMVSLIAVSAVSRSHDPSGDLQVTTYDSNVRVEVLAVDGPAPSRVRLRFLQNEGDKVRGLKRVAW